MEMEEIKAKRSARQMSIKCSSDKRPRRKIKLRDSLR